MSFPDEFNPVAVYVYGIRNKAKALEVNMEFARVGFEAPVSWKETIKIRCVL